MDPRVVERLSLWHNHLDTLRQAQLTCLTLESQEKPLWSSLFLRAEGKTVAEKEAWVYSQEDWMNFQRGLVQAKVEFDYEKAQLRLKEAAYQATYLQSKQELEAVQRFPKAMT